MGKYTELKNLLSELQEHLDWRKLVYKKIEKRDEICERISSLSDNKKPSHDIYVELAKLKEYHFENIEITHVDEEWQGIKNIDDVIETIHQYDLRYQEEGINKFDFSSFIDYLKSLPEIVVGKDVIDNFKHHYQMINYSNALRNDANFKKEADMARRIMSANGVYRAFYALAYDVALAAHKWISSENMQVMADVLNGAPLSLINSIAANVIKLNKMISNDEVLSDFTDEDLRILSETIKIAKEMLEPETFNEDYFSSVIEMIRNDQKAKKESPSIAREEVVSPTKKRVVTFDNLDMSILNGEETQIIERIKQILKNIEVGSKSYKDIELTVDSRSKAYSNAKIKDILSDVSELLNHIYDDKDTVIAIFKVIIYKYVDYVREKHKEEYRKIIGIISNIIEEIKRKYNLNTGGYDAIAYDKIAKLVELRDNITGYLEIYEYSVTSGNDFDSMDAEAASIIVETRKNIAAVVESEKLDKIDVRTINLVFCLDDMDLSDPSFSNDFNSIVTNLEYRELYDMNLVSDVKGLTVLKNGTEDITTYLRRVTGRRPHFVPYIYFDNESRMCVIEYNPSTIVKSYLKKYVVSESSGYYGIYRMISNSEFERNGYDNLITDILNDFRTIESIAGLLANDNPTDEQLRKIDSICEEKLQIKANLKARQDSIRK